MSDPSDILPTPERGRSPPTPRGPGGFPTASPGTTGPARVPREEHVGLVRRYDEDRRVAELESDRGAVRVGDYIHVRGAGADFRARVHAIEVDGHAARKASAGERAFLPLRHAAPPRAEVLRMPDPYAPEQGAVLDAFPVRLPGSTG